MQSKFICFLLAAVAPQVPRMKNPNPFYLGTLKKTLTERETEDMFNSIKWVTPGTYHRPINAYV